MSTKTSFPTRVENRYVKHGMDRLAQGDILRDVGFYHTVISPDGQKAIEEVRFSYGVVVSQECDLHQDFMERIDAKKHDKHLHSVLILPGFLEEEFKVGQHLAAFKQVRETKGSEQMKRIKHQNEARYHHLPGNPELQVPDLILDFKLSFSIPHADAYGNLSGRYLATVNELYRDQLSQRFASFLGRIGLPE